MQDYNKLVIFDLDGVLIDSREIHYEALNRALQQVDPQYVIPRETHLASYDGLPTSRKLKLLTEQKGLPKELYQRVWELKQSYTIDLYDEYIHEDLKLIEIFSNLQLRGWKIGVASNSIRKTLTIAIQKLGLAQLVDSYVSNEDVSKAKPFPEMYWKLMNEHHAIPNTTIIVEDSHIGRQAALDSGATLVPVERPEDVTIGLILDATNKLEDRLHSTSNTPWRDKRLNVVIPMGGRGSRFARVGYDRPKPLIDVNGKPMIQVVLENLNIDAHYIYIVQKEQEDQYNLRYLLNLITPGCTIVEEPLGALKGPANAMLLIEDLIDTNDPLLIANCDQYIKWSSNEVMYAFAADEIDGGILTFKADDPKWSYVKLDKDGFVCDIVEKQVISNDATVGIYYWAKGKDFVECLKTMMRNEHNKVNGEWYIAPVYKELLKREGARIRVKEVDEMWGLGTPEDLDYFLENHENE